MEKSQRFLHILWQYVCMWGALVSFFMIPIWIYLIAPELTRIPNDFSYHANILSINNFYNEKLNKFEGDQISKIIYNYDVLAATSNYLLLQNKFVLSTQGNKPILMAVKKYIISPYNSKNIITSPGSKLSGFLFAPTFCSKKDFLYQHVTSDMPVKMKYINTQKLAGLTVHHYQANFNSDLTKYTTDSSEFSQKRGIEANVMLQIWVEPVSGWLVAYQENAIAYYYDQKTHQKLMPWNKFSNRYTQNSIEQQVKNATYLKWKIIIIDVGGPLFFFMMSMILILIRRGHYYFNFLNIVFEKYAIFTLFSVVAIGTLLEGAYYIYSYGKTNSAFKIIGVAPWNNTPEMLEAVHGFKDGMAEEGFINGKNIKYLQQSADSKIEKQIDIIQSFIHLNVNLIFTLTTQGTLVAKEMTNQIPIVFSVVTYPEEENIIDSLVSSKNNLVGTLNYLPLAQQFHVFEKIYPMTKILGFVHHAGEPTSDIQYNEFKNMLARRGIDVVDIAGIDADDIKQQLEMQLQKTHYNTLYLACDNLLQQAGEVVIEFANKNKIPTFSCTKDNVLKGALIGYVADYYAMGKYAGKKAALILNGADPSWLHTEYPGLGYLIVNLPTARLLGITIDPSTLRQANYVVGK